jgi:Cu/Ag efflux protein CusF
MEDCMRRVVLLALVAVVAVAMPALAQVKEIPGETMTATVTIEAIDHATRTLTLKQEDGTYMEFVVAPSVKRFDELKVGDKITARYYTNITIRRKQPGEKDVDTLQKGDSKNASRPGVTIAKQRTITATITQLDPKIPSITFQGPNNWTYSSRVHDKKAIEKLKVGDKVDITWTEATLVDAGPAAKK